MKITFKTTTHRLLSVLLCGALLWAGFSAQPSFLGPGLSAAAAEMVATATDVPLLPIEQNENSITAITPNPNIVTTPNSVLQIVVNQDNIGDANIQIIFGDHTYLYGYKNVDITPQRANTMVSVHYGDDYEYIIIDLNESDAVTQGQKLLRFYFYTSPAWANPCSEITWSATDADNNTITNAFTYQLALLGNPEYDSNNGESITNGAINSSDYLWILQYASGRHDETCCPDIELRELAADVDLSGHVSAPDSIPIMNYSVGKCRSFLDINRIFPPYGNTVPQAPCQIKSVQTQRYLQRASNSALCLWNSNTSSSGLFRFEKVSSSSKVLYRIYSLYDNQELCLDTNNNLVLTNSGATIQPQSNQWYVIPSGAGFVIMNQQTGDQTLGDLGRTNLLSQCGVSYLDYGNVWEITPHIRLELFYDAAYVERHTDDTNVQGELNDIRNQMAAILENIFGISVNTSINATQHTSLLDSRFGADYVNQMDSFCNCPGTNPNVCKEYNSTGSPPGSAVHHTSSVAQLYHFKTTKSNGIAYRLLYTGYRNCGRRKLDNGQEIHDTNVVAGVANASGLVALAFFEVTVNSTIKG